MLDHYHNLPIIFKMKHYLIAIPLLAILAFPMQTFAEEGSSSENPLEDRVNNRTLIKEKRDSFINESQELRTDLRDSRKGFLGIEKERRNELEEQIKTNREALRTEIQNIRKEKASLRKGFVEKRFTQVIVVLSNAQGRLALKIAELESKSYDMSEAKVNLDKSKTSLASAQTLFATLSNTSVSDTDESSVTKPRETAKQIEVLLKETREHLKETIRAIKKAVNPEPEDEDDDSNDDSSSATN